MRHRPKGPEPWKRKMKRRGRTPGRRCDISSITNRKKSSGGLKRPSSSSSPSTSAHSSTTRSQSYQYNFSTRVRSPIASPATKQKGNDYNRPCRWRRVSRKGKTRGAAQGSKWAKHKRCSRYSTPSPPPQTPIVENKTGQNQGTPANCISGLDITSCQWLYYGAYVSNETRSIEFKKGGGCYMQRSFCDHVSIYGCAFLNSGGGSLLVGVDDDGSVCGVHFSHKNEDETRLKVDMIVKQYHPPLLPYNYSLHFLPVVKPGDEEHHLRVLCLTFRAPPAFTEPTLFQTDEGQVYIRRDGSVQGPLGISFIIEWSRQMWTGKVQQLEQCVREARSEKWFFAGQVHGLLQSIHPLHQFILSLEPQKNTVPSRGRGRKMKQHLKSSSRNSQASASLPPVGTPDARPAHKTGAPDLALESSPSPEHS